MRSQNAINGFDPGSYGDSSLFRNEPCKSHKEVSEDMDGCFRNRIMNTPAEERDYLAQMATRLAEIDYQAAMEAERTARVLGFSGYAQGGWPPRSLAGVDLDQWAKYAASSSGSALSLPIVPPWPAGAVNPYTSTSRMTVSDHMNAQAVVDAKVERRRARERESARRSRRKKKELAETLEQKVQKLTDENAELKKQLQHVSDVSSLDDSHRHIVADIRRLLREDNATDEQLHEIAAKLRENSQLKSTAVRRVLDDMSRVLDPVRHSEALLWLFTHMHLVDPSEDLSRYRRRDGDSDSDSDSDTSRWSDPGDAAGGYAQPTAGPTGGSKKTRKDVKVERGGVAATAVPQGAQPFLFERHSAALGHMLPSNPDLRSPTGSATGLHPSWPPDAPQSKHVTSNHSKCSSVTSSDDALRSQPPRRKHSLGALDLRPNSPPHADHHRPAPPTHARRDSTDHPHAAAHSASPSPPSRRHSTPAALVGPQAGQSQASSPITPGSGGQSDARAPGANKKESALMQPGSRERVELERKLVRQVLAAMDLTISQRVHLPLCLERSKPEVDRVFSRQKELLALTTELDSMRRQHVQDWLDFSKNMDVLDHIFTPRQKARFLLMCAIHTDDIEKISTQDALNGLHHPDSFSASNFSSATPPSATGSNTASFSATTDQRALSSSMSLVASMPRSGSLGLLSEDDDAFCSLDDGRVSPARDGSPLTMNAVIMSGFDDDPTGRLALICEDEEFLVMQQPCDT